VSRPHDRQPAWRRNEQQRAEAQRRDQDNARRRRLGVPEVGYGDGSWLGFGTDTSTTSSSSIFGQGHRDWAGGIRTTDLLRWSYDDRLRRDQRQVSEQIVADIHRELAQHNADRIRHRGARRSPVGAWESAA